MTDIVVTLSKDLKDIETSVLLPPGTYEAEVISAEKKVGPSGADYISYNVQLYKDSKPATKVFENISLQEQALWKLKAFLIALGIKEPKGKKLNITQTVGRKFYAEIVITDYQKSDGTTIKKNEIVDCFPLEQKPSKPTPIVQAKEIANEEEEISFE